MTLEEVDCTGNDGLTMIPEALRRDTALVLFICKLHRDHGLEHTELLGECEAREDAARRSEERNLRMRDEIDNVALEMKRLREEQRGLAALTQATGCCVVS